MQSNMEQLVAKQAELETLYNKNQLMTRLRAEVEDGDVLPSMLRDAGIDVKFGTDLLIQMNLHKRCSIETLAGTLRKHFDTAQETVDAIEKAIMADFVDYDMRSLMCIAKYVVSAQTQAELDMFQFPLPMVVPPCELKGNRDVGYLGTKGSVILKDNHHEFDVNLQHLNRMNSIKLCLNMDTAQMIQNKWRNLDRPKDGETAEDFQKRRKAFDKFDRTARAAYDLLNNTTDHFYLTHKYDKRGRTYCQGYHVNYQGNSWNKATVEFYNREHID